MGSGPRDGRHGALVFAPAPELTVTSTLAAGLGSRVCVLGGPNPSAPPVPADLYVLSDGELLSVRAPRVHAVDTAGAGDSVTAGVAAGLAGGRSFVDSLRLGIAAATLNVARHGLASGSPTAIEATAHSVHVGPAAAQEVAG